MSENPVSELGFGVTPTPGLVFVARWTASPAEQVRLASRVLYGGRAGWIWRGVCFLVFFAALALMQLVLRPGAMSVANSLVIPLVYGVAVAAILPPVNRWVALRRHSKQGQDCRLVLDDRGLTRSGIGMERLQPWKRSMDCYAQDGVVYFVRRTGLFSLPVGVLVAPSAAWSCGDVPCGSDVVIAFAQQQIARAGLNAAR